MTNLQSLPRPKQTIAPTSIRDFMITPASLHRSTSLLILGLAFTAGTARAQDIRWREPQPITGIKDISQHGTYVDAIQCYAGADWGNAGAPASTLTIGDTIFHTVKVGKESCDDGKMISFALTKGQLYFTSGNNPATGWNLFPTGSPSSSDYSSVVSSGVYISSGDPNGTVTFSQLQTGHTYEVQVWAFVQDGDHGLTTLSGKAPVTLDNLAGNPPASGPLPAGSYGQYVIGTFTATGSTEKFDWSCGGGSYALISSIALRDTSDPSATP